MIICLSAVGDIENCRNWHRNIFICYLYYVSCINCWNKKGFSPGFCYKTQCQAISIETSPWKHLTLIDDLDVYELWPPPFFVYIWLGLNGTL